MVQLDKIIIDNIKPQYIRACLSRYDKEIDQQTNYVGSPDKNTDELLLLISDI